MTFFSSLDKDKRPLVLQDIPDKIVVGWKSRQVIMSGAMDADKGDLMRIELLKFFTVPDWDEPVACAMQDIGMTVHFPDPLVGMQVIAQEPAMGQEWSEPLRHLDETEIGCIQDQVTRLVICCEFDGETASKAAAINKYMVFFKSGSQLPVNILHIRQQIFLTPFAGAFAKTPVINQHYIISISVKIPRTFGPAFDASGIAMQVKDQALGFGTKKVQAINADTRFRRKK